MNISIVLKCLFPSLLVSLFGFGQTASFLSNFEDQNIEPEIGKAAIELNKANMYVVPNPSPDAVNNSKYVLKMALSPGVARRSEYTVSRMETNEKKYIYTWSVYHPFGMFTNTNLGFLALNQWKTWPCEAGPISNPDYKKYDDLICSGGGIFNDMFYEFPQKVRYRARAKPNCISNLYGVSSPLLAA